MLYVTIIIIAILAVSCIITCNYLNHRYNPSLYEDDCQYTKLQDCKIIAESIITRFDDYNDAEEEDKYKFHVSDKEIYNAFENIIRISCNNNDLDD